MYRLVTVHTHGGFLVLPPWKTRPPVPDPIFWNHHNHHLIPLWIAWLLLFYLLAKSKVISWKELICDSAHSWRFIVLSHSKTNQIVSTMSWYHTQSLYPDTELSSHCLMRVMPNARIGNSKHPVGKPLGLARPVFEPSACLTRSMPALLPQVRQPSLYIQLRYWYTS